MGYISQRVTYGNTLMELGRQGERIMVLGADLGTSTMGKLFGTEFPRRHLEMGITEANMTSMAAGLAQTGEIPFTNSFTVFADGWAYDQIRQTIVIRRLSIRVYGSSSGLSDFGDGTTHQCVEGLAIFRAVPNMIVVCPADANETVGVVKTIAVIDDPYYLHLNRNDYPDMIKEGEKSTSDVPDALEEGTDIALFATGYMAGLTLEAATELEGSVSVKVISVSTIKPMDTEAVREMAKGYRAVVMAEEHNVTGGLGSALAEVLCGNPKPMKIVGIKDTFGYSGHNYREVSEFRGLTKAATMGAVMEMAKL